jgi:hypothetical protein
VKIILRVGELGGGQRSRLNALFFTTAMNSLVQLLSKMKEIHRLDFMQQLPLELILPEV